MDMNKRFELLKWKGYKPPMTDLTYRSSEDSPLQADTYVTRDEIYEFQSSVYELMRLFLDFYIACAIELETSSFDVHCN